MLYLSYRPYERFGRCESDMVWNIDQIYFVLRVNGLKTGWSNSPKILGTYFFEYNVMHRFIRVPINVISCFETKRLFHISKRYLFAGDKWSIVLSRHTWSRYLISGAVSMYKQCLMSGVLVILVVVIIIRD